MVDSHETHNMYPNLSAIPLNTPLNGKQHFRLNKINEIKDFVAEIEEGELMSKRLSKYIASFNCFDKLLSVTTGSISIALFASVIGAPVEITSASFNLVFSICTRIVKKLLKTTTNKRKSTIKLFC